MLDVEKFVGELHEYFERAFAPFQFKLKTLEDRKPEKGEKGEKGDHGEPGNPGKDADPIELRAVVLELAACHEIKTVIDLLVVEAVSARMATVKDGKDGADGLRGDKGEQGVKGDIGKDGRGTAGAMIDREGTLILTMTDGTTEKLGHIVGKDGTNGEHGKDGLGVESLEREYDAEAHEVVERWTVAGKTKELRYPAGGIRDGGYWRAGMKALAAQAVTHDGTLWIALRDTSAKPCLENKDDWRIAARKGRDGVDGTKGRDLGPAPPVKLGNANA